nr:neuromedin-U receptor 1-like isoform X2 [Labrus bergylta]
MLELNCSLADLFSSNSTIFNGPGCPDAALACGMNISWVLANTTAKDLDVLCWRVEDYLAGKLGLQTSPVFLPICVTYLTIFLVGVLGNSLTCVVILRYRVMQTPTNYYLLSLAASDLLVLLLGMPLEIYEMWQNYPFLLGEGGCYFKTFLFETVCFASILNVTALSVERYVAVVHPLKVKHMTTRARVKRVIFMLWVLSMLCAVPNTSLQGIEELEPLFGRRFPQSAVCSVLVVVFGFCWAPFHLDRLMWSYMDTSDEKHIHIFGPIHIVSGVFFYLSSAINPILYNLMSTRFREMFSHITCCSKRWQSRSSLKMTQRSTLSDRLTNSLKTT